MLSTNNLGTTYWVHFRFQWSRDADKTDWEHLLYARKCIRDGTAWKSLTPAGGPGFVGSGEPILSIQLMGPLEDSENWLELADAVLKVWADDIFQKRGSGVPWSRNQLFVAEGSPRNHAVVGLSGKGYHCGAFHA